MQNHVSLDFTWGGSANKKLGTLIITVVHFVMHQIDHAQKTDEFSNWNTEGVTLLYKNGF